MATSEGDSAVSCEGEQAEKGKGQGHDHQKWPNAHFTAMGLISLKQAHQAIKRHADLYNRVTLPTGEPDAANPPVRFGGSGSVNPLFVPLYPGKFINHG